MNYWKPVRLKNLCLDAGQYGMNVSNESYTDAGVRLIRTTDISSGELTSTEKGVFVRGCDSDRFELKEGDLLLSRSGTPPGQSYLVKKEDQGSTFAGYLVRFRPAGNIDPRFISYIARSAPFQHKIHSESVASTIQNFNAERYANIEFLAPNQYEQVRIADFLDVETSRIDALMSARDSQLELVEELWQAQLTAVTEKLISDHGLIPLRRVVSRVEQGWSPQCEESEAKPDEWAVLKTSAVSSGLFKPTEHKRLPGNLTPDLRHQVEDGDILMTRGSGSPAHVGVAAVARTNGRKILLSDLLYRVKIGRDWDPDYITLLLGSYPIRGFMSLLFRGQSGQTIKLRSEDIKSITIPAAPFMTQGSIVRELSNMRRNSRTAQRALARSNALLAERRQALITAAVTGQFDVSTASGRNVTDGVQA